MRFLRATIFIAIALVLVVLGLANRQLVTLKLLPFETDLLFGRDFIIQMPLFVVILIGVLLGLLIGLLWEYLREGKYRRAMTKNARALQSAQQELQQVKKPTHSDKDDILALLEEPK